tara:strand:+ start:1038 stop:1622 length:585 start_codon:yes stop_codon:yes gene_type:complete
MKKAAMFGLDARIALAIFGALSVISGAALYSAIQQAKTTALITELNELGKALEQYYLDVGSYPARMGSDNTVADYYAFKSLALVTNDGKAGWNGPYYAASELRTNQFRNVRGEDVWFAQYKTGDWSSYTSGQCTTGLTCGLWVRLWQDPRGLTDSQIASLDKTLDNSDGASKGKLRWDANSINYLYSVSQNPND